MSKQTEFFPKPRIYESILFILILSGPPRLRIRDPFASLSGSIDWSVGLNLAVWSLAAFWVSFSIIGMLLSGKGIIKPNPLHVLALVLIVFLYLSTLNSEAPALTVYRVSQAAIVLVFGMLWVPKFGVASTLRHMVVAFGVLGVMIIGAAFVAPELVYSAGALVDTSLTPREGIRGDAIASTGTIAAMALIIILSYKVVSNAVLRWSMIGGFSVLLLLSQTRTSYAVVLIILLLAALRFPKSVPLRLIIYFSTVAIPLVLILGGGAAISERLTRGGTNLSTLSERTPLWEYVVSETLNLSPWTGVGFYANRSITTAFNPDLGTSHSMYIEIFSGGGILSFTVFSVLILSTLWYGLWLFLKYGREPEAFALIGLFIATLLIGVTSEESIIASPASFVFWMSFSLIPFTGWLFKRRSEVARPTEDPEESTTTMPRALSAKRP